MSGPKKPSAPNAGSGAGSSCDNTTIACPLHCPKVEIQINPTLKPPNNLVPIKCLLPAADGQITQCRIRAVGAGAPTYTVVLTNPDHRLRFPGDADTMLSIDLPPDGSWFDFAVSGVRGSAKLDDAQIEVHCGTAAGSLLAMKPVTVFWLDAHLDITVGGTYESAFGDVQFRVVGQPAVSFKASAEIKPKAIDCTAPQIRDLRVGIIQNSMPPDGNKARIRKVLYGPPTMTWLQDAKPGIKVSIPSQWHRTLAIEVISNDSTDATAPFYGLSEGKDHKPAIHKPPIGCKGGSIAASQDTPGTPLHGSISVRVTDGSGHMAEWEPVTDFFDKKLETAAVIGGKGVTLGTAIYPFQQVIHKEKFITWVVVFNEKTKAFCCLRQRTWILDLDSSDPSRWTAKPDAADAEPTVAPVTDKPFSNILNDHMNNWVTGQVPGASVEFSNTPP
jgi:hypothetical protein